MKQVNRFTLSGLKEIVLILLVVVFSVLHKVNTYGPVLFGYTLAVYALIWFCFLLVVQFLGRRLLAKKEAAIIYTLFTGVFLLNYGELQDFLLNTVKSKLLASNWLLVAVFFLLSGIAWVLFKKRHWGFTKTKSFLLFLFALFALIEVVKLTGKRALFYNYRSVQPQIPLAKTAGPKPDIYYLIFDSYTSPSVLNAYWKFANDSLHNFLQQNNFTISNNAQSPYDFTVLSVNAIFNMNYLPVPRGGLEKSFVNFNYGRKIFHDSFIPKWFRAQGYTIDCHSMVSLESNNNLYYPFAPDEPLHWLRRQTVERIWLVPSVLKKMVSLLGLKKKFPAKTMSALQQLKAYNETMLDTLLQMPVSDSPRFVYAHFNLPHGPYMFKRDGSLRAPAEAINATIEQQKAFYLDQIVYTNTYIRQVVSSLLHTGKKDKVIILQGDHGFREYLPQEQGNKLGVLNAVYFPDGDYSKVSDSLLTVNTFRVVLNKYFRQNLPMLH